jgi:hypothetical protein
MLHRWAAPALVLALCAMVPEQAAGQTQQSPGRKAAGRLGQNYPNPFNPETTIPFSVGPSDCSEDAGKQYVVTLRVYNVLAQLVAIPRLQASSGGTTAGSQPINGIRMGCGNYTALWDGKYLNTQREVASGVYVYELIIDGRRLTGKMFVAK